MFARIKYWAITAVLVGMAMLGTNSMATAAFRLRVESGTTTGPGVVVTDNGAGDSSAATNIITTTPTITGFTVSITSGLQTPLLIIPGFFEGMDLFNISISSGGAGTLRLILESDEFGAKTPKGIVTLVNSVGGTLTAPAGSSITFSSYANAAKGMPALGKDVFDAGVLDAIPGAGAGSIGDGATVVSQKFTPPPGAFSGTVGTSFDNSAGTYSLYSVVTVTFTGSGTLSFDAITGTTPAPAGLVLLASAIPALGLGWLRRRKLKLSNS